MKQWKVIIEHNNIRKEIVLSGDRYSDVYLDTVIEYSGCIVTSITFIRS